MPRLTAKFWVDAYLRRLDRALIPAFVVAKGDETAGAILVKSNTLNGLSILYNRIYDGEGKRIWAELASGTESDLDEIIAKQRKYDPDLWVIEVEDRGGRTLLDEDGLLG